MKTYLYPLLAGLLSLAACTNDTLQEIAPVAPGENNSTSNTGKGTFFVDYSVDGGASTRAGNPLKVQTLDYYVYYAEGGELVKHRRIRIDSNQSFPLTRENMTWEQRQALQDTLQYDVKYRTLFIANVDSTLFNYGTYSSTNSHPAVVTGDTLYQNARILLPNVPFHEDNYYCLWEDTLHQLSTKPLNGPMKRNDVLLQRIVTRTDISRTSSPTELYDAIAEGFYKENCEQAVIDAVNKWIDDFCNRIEKCAEYSLDLVGEHVNIHKNEDNIKKLTTELKLEDNTKKVIAAYKDLLINEYADIIESKYNERIQNWYVDGRTLKAIYRSGTRANALSFERVASHYMTDDSEYNDEATCTIDENGLVTIIGYQGKDEELNIVTSLEFSDFNITGTNATLTINQGINDWYETTCDPCTEVLFHGNTSLQEKTVNLLDIMAGISIWNDLRVNKDGLKDAADYFWDDCFLNHSSADRHGDDDCDFSEHDFDRFPIKATLPDLTDENVDTSIELIPAWTYEDKTTNNNP